MKLPASARCWPLLWSLPLLSKQGDRYLRGLFVAGALAVIRYAKIHGTKHRPGSRPCWRGGRPRLLLLRLPQARANGLGHDGQGRAIQGTRRACGVKTRLGSFFQLLTSW